MEMVLNYGRQHAHLEIAEDALVRVTGSPWSPSPLSDVAAAVHDALETPLEYPALRRALTPDDQVAIVVDERLPRLPALLVPLLEHIVSAGVPPSAITLLCSTPSTGQPWLEELPEALEDVRCEIHDPHDRRKLSFVTTARNGRPLFFNRTAVDAAQLVVLSGRRYDPLLGHGGGAGAIYPAFSDEATRSLLSQWLSLDAPTLEEGRIEQEATEAAWLLGAPFFVQVIEGEGDDVIEVIAGTSTALTRARQRHDWLWQAMVSRLADTVVATVVGDPARQTFADLADAVSSASRVVQPGGIIAVLSEASFPAGPAVGLLREAGDPAQALKELDRRKELELSAAWQWASVARNARICLLSGLDARTVEGLFATRLDNLEQLQRLVALSRSCLFLPNAHKMMAAIVGKQT